MSAGFLDRAEDEEATFGVDGVSCPSPSSTFSGPRAPVGVEGLLLADRTVHESGVDSTDFLESGVEISTLSFGF